MPKSHWQKHKEAKNRHQDADNAWRKAEDDQRNAEAEDAKAQKAADKVRGAMEKIYDTYKKAAREYQRNPNDANLNTLEFWKSWYWWVHELIYDRMNDWLEKKRRDSQKAREKAADAWKEKLRRRKEMEKARMDAERMDKFRRELDKSPHAIPDVKYISPEKAPEVLMLALKDEGEIHKMFEEFLADGTELL